MAPEGFQRAIGKPFGRARRRETSAIDKAIVLRKNNMKVVNVHALPVHGRRGKCAW